MREGGEEKARGYKRCIKEEFERGVIGGWGGLLYLIIEAIPTREKSRKNKFLYVRA